MQGMIRCQQGVLVYCRPAYVLRTVYHHILMVTPRLRVCVVVIKAQRAGVMRQRRCQQTNIALNPVSISAFYSQRLTGFRRSTTVQNRCTIDAQ